MSRQQVVAPAQPTRRMPVPSIESEPAVTVWDARAPIFVVGTARAGTTLVSRILGRHTAVLAPGETHFYEDLWGQRDRFGDLTTADALVPAADFLLRSFERYNQDYQSVVDDLLTRDMLIGRALALGGGYANLYYAFMGLLTEAAGKTRFCDDTPKHLFHLDTIFTQFPDARVIACVRDARDFLCSYRSLWTRSRDPQRLKALYHPVMTSTLWRTSARQMRRCADVAYPGRVHIVQYEKLVADPATAVREFCTFTGLTYSDDLLNVAENNSSFERGRSGIFTSSVGRWRDCLEPEEVWTVQRIAGEEMAYFSYEPVPTAVAPHKLARIFLSTPSAFVRAVRANTGRREPLPRYLLRRAKALFAKV